MRWLLIVQWRDAVRVDILPLSGLPLLVVAALGLTFTYKADSALFSIIRTTLSCKRGWKMESSLGISFSGAGAGG